MHPGREEFAVLMCRHKCDSFPDNYWYVGYKAFLQPGHENLSDSASHWEETGEYE